jgi:radical SAM superfamily enzyme YgiQ (UPF0313 family)
MVCVPGPEPRRTRITLVQAPVFSRLGPCNGLALIKAHLQAAGIPAEIRDSSMNLRRALKSRGLTWNEYLFYDSEGLLGAAEARLPGFMEEFLRDEAEEILKTAPDIVGFSVQYPSWECCLTLARFIKQSSPQTLVVCGGPECIRETRAFELIRHRCVDAVALGEADTSMASFVRAFNPKEPFVPSVPGFLIKREGKVVDLGDAPEVKELDLLPFMDFTGFDMEAYLPDTLFIVASRGCVRKCSFCADIVHRKTYRRMSAERILAEIRHQMRHYPDRYFVRFDDSLINGDVRLMARLSDILAPFRLERAVQRSRQDFGWGGMAIIHPTMSPALLGKMRRGGCQTLAYGFESASQKVLGLMNKGFRVEDAERTIRDTKRAGIRVQVFVMVGFPGETDEDFRLTLEFLERNAGFIDIIDPSICSILKGSHLDTHREQYGIISDSPQACSWASADGTSTPAVRLARFRTLMDHSRRLGFQDSDYREKVLKKP